MNRNAISAILAILILAAAAVPHNLPPELKAPHELRLFNWLVKLAISWGVALLILIAAYKFGPEPKFDDSPKLLDLFHWKHFPHNWREMLFLLIVVVGVALPILTIAFISAYGGPGG